MRQLVAKVVERGELADVLRGKNGPSLAKLTIRAGQLPIKLESGQIAVGYANERNSVLPSILIVRERELREIFAWVNTYCPFVTPLSQWCRVVTEHDLKRIGAGGEQFPQYGKAITAWAGAAIGEAMLRVGVPPKAQHVSLAALQSCSTFVAARAFGLWGSEGRRQASAFHKEARQLLGSSAVQPDLGHYETVWNVLEALASDRPNPRRKTSLVQASEIVVECCRDIQKSGFVEIGNLAKTLAALGWSRDFEKYEQCTAEERLDIYDQAIARLTEPNTVPQTKTEMMAQFIVAYFASKISGSVSGHISLIERLLTNQPMVILWYGVVSSLHQPEIWGSEFSGLARLATRELGYPVRLVEAPRCDVSLEELRTLADPAGTHSTLGFRGASPKALSVELSVGVTGVIRLIDGNEEAEKRASMQVNEETRSRMRHVIASLRSALSAAEPVQAVLEEQQGGGSPVGSYREPKRSTPKQGPGGPKGRAMGSDSQGRYREGKLPFDEPC